VLFRSDKIDSYYNNKEIEEARKTAEKIAKDAEVIDNRQLQNSLDALKIQSDVATKINNSTGKGTASERIAILEQYKSALYDLASIGGWTAEQFDKISDAIIRVDGEIQGSKDNLKDYKISWTDTMNSINKSILNFVANSINYLAESLGKALAGENIEVFKGLALLLADSLIEIGKALVAYAVPVLLALTLLKKPSIPTAIAAIAAGTAAIVAGSFLKSKLSNNQPKAFANGGIISGPTMGLMGEYPGAASNPEVVAPLDKLQSLIGGAGGNLEARISGNDLLILMNKAGRNNQNTF
jgi:vacuolar-type H+-ATPase subunit H